MNNRSDNGRRWGKAFKYTDTSENNPKIREFKYLRSRIKQYGRNRKIE